MTSNTNVVSTRVRNDHGVLKHPEQCDPTSPLNHQYEAIIDYMIANAEMKKGAIAEYFGFTGPYFSTLTGSDAFRMRLEFRRAEFNGSLNQQVVSKLFDVTEKALNVVAEKLADEEVEGAFALSAATLTLRHLGFGGAATKPAMPTTEVGVQVKAEPDGRLEVIVAARERMQQVAVLTHDGAHEGVIQGELVSDGVG